MSLIEINRHPEDRELRKFGIIAIVVLTAASCVLYFLLNTPIALAGALFAAGLVIFVISLISANITRIIYLGLTFAALPIGLVVSFAVLALFYFLLLTPVALVFRLIGRDVLSRRFEPEAESYWVKRRLHDDLKRYFHQF